jgi:hypothetical protein
MMTSQEVFDAVLFGLRAQGVASVVEAPRGDGCDDERFVCMYRGKNGTKCAAGMLLPDEAYKPTMEGVAATSSQYSVDHDQQGRLAVWPALLAAGVPPDAGGLVQTLQSDHDDAMPRTKGGSMVAWELRMYRTAQHFNLKYTEPA